MNNELEVSLQQKINETYHASVSLAAGAKEQALAAINKARECGQYLIEAKQEVGHGNWRDWLASHVVNMHFNTAIRYMKLADTPDDKLTDAYSLRQAYIAAGILDKGGNTTDGARNHDPDGSNWIGALSKLTISVERLFDSRPVDQWEESDREMFCVRVEPIVKRYVQAGGSLASL